MYNMIPRSEISNLHVEKVRLLSLLFIYFHLLVQQAATTSTPQTHLEFQKIQNTNHHPQFHLMIVFVCSWLVLFIISPYHHHHLITPW
ncbi:hypothetical protein FPQ18DRAFT_343324 [Pyronema domesticum]|nr:hypothetical protein FPQ18DRAFT_343324 [Pyronema domesticum]